MLYVWARGLFDSVSLPAPSPGLDRSWVALIAKLDALVSRLDAATFSPTETDDPDAPTCLPLPELSASIDANPAELQTRWAARPALLRQLLEALGAGQPYDGLLAELPRGDEVAGRADLRGITIGFTALPRARLAGVCLRRADLRYARLHGADLRGASLVDADLSWARLQKADLRDADLRGASLADAILDGVRLDGADLREADLRGAHLSRHALARARHEEAKLPDRLEESRESCYLTDELVQKQVESQFREPFDATWLGDRELFRNWTVVLRDADNERVLMRSNTRSMMWVATKRGRAAAFRLVEGDAARELDLRYSYAITAELERTIREELALGRPIEDALRALHCRPTGRSVHLLGERRNVDGWTRYYRLSNSGIIVVRVDLQDTIRDLQTVAGPESYQLGLSVARAVRYASENG
jgi:uncharacterized protein YjbI with pentapeptide repeats